MTTFILHGGYTSTPNESNKKYYSEILNRIPENGKILFIYFAQEKTKWPDLFKNDKEKIERRGIQKLDLEIASSEKSQLTKQINSANCIYIRGGRDNHLKEILKNLGNFKELIQEKLVVGSSAGANVLSKYYYRNSKQCIEEGLGVLSIKVFCHYNETKKEALKQLKTLKENLPIYTIPKTEFVIIKK